MYSSRTLPTKVKLSRFLFICYKPAQQKAQNVTLQMELTVPEQILASVSGAGITALTMTPFDVVKGIYLVFDNHLILNLQVRSQMTKTPKMVNYCNGLMDHIICCREATSKGNKCTRLLRMPLKRPMSCIEAKRCISTQECKFTTKLAFGAEVSKASKPW